MRNQCEQRLSQRNVEASGASVELTDTKYIYIHRWRKEKLRLVKYLGAR